MATGSAQDGIRGRLAEAGADTRPCFATRSAVKMTSGATASSTACLQSSGPGSSVPTINLREMGDG